MWWYRSRHTILAPVVFLNEFCCLHLRGATTFSEVLLPFSTKKLERYTQFGAVCYPHQTPHQKATYKVGVRPFFFGGGGPPNGCAHVTPV